MVNITKDFKKILSHSLYNNNETETIDTILYEPLFVRSLRLLVQLSINGRME